MGGRKNPCLAERGSWARSGFPSFPHSRHHKAVLLLGQLFHRVSCSPLLSCSAPGRGPAAPHSCAAPPQAEDQAASIYSSLNLDSLVEGKGRPSDKKLRQLSLVSVVHTLGNRPLTHSLNPPHDERPGLFPQILLTAGVNFTSLMAWTGGTGPCVPRTQVAQLKFHPQSKNLEWDI